MPKPSQDEQRPWAIVQAVRELFEGRSHAVGQVTLTANTTTTTVTAPNIGADTRITLFPRHASAATELGAGGMYVSSVKAGQFVITHANDASTSRLFDWHALG